MLPDGTVPNMSGRSIKIFLVDGDPAGLRTVEVGLSTLKALIAPRAALERLRARDEADRTGVYLLLGDDDTAPGGVAVYVGEGDSVIDRIVRHDSTRDFWHTVVLFTSKDDNLNKAHARWLEARLVEMAKQAVRARVVNDTQPGGGTLSEGDVAEMHEVIAQVRMVLGSVGFDVFAPLSLPSRRAPDQPAAQAEPAAAPVLRFGYSGAGFDASMELSSGGYVVRQGSKARKDEAASLQQTYKTMRASLISGGVLVDDGTCLNFASDYVFKSPSAAAGVVSGTTLGGGVSWKLPDGKNLAAWEAEQTAAQEPSAGGTDVSVQSANEPVLPPAPGSSPSGS